MHNGEGWYLRAACRRRLDVVGLVGCLPYPGSCPSRSRSSRRALPPGLLSCPSGSSRIFAWSKIIIKIFNIYHIITSHQ